MPIQLNFTLVPENGRNNYVLQISDTYRDMMTMVGITYDVQAFVRVNFPESGTVTLSPDFSFSNCMDGGRVITTGDTMQIHPNDPDHYYILPFAKWKNDSIRFVWNGTGSADLWFSYNCEFEPDMGDPDLLLHLSLPAGDTLAGKFTSQQIKEYLDQFKIYSDDAESGLYYLKITSNTAGTAKLEKVPQTPPQNGAIELKIGKSTLITDSNQVYCFSKYWTDAMQFICPTDYRVSGYFANSGSFYLADASSYRFAIYEDQHVLSLTKAEMATLAAGATDDYVYVRFGCNTQTTVTPQLWENDCAAQNTILVHPNETISIEARSTQTYRMLYNEIEGYELAFRFSGSTTMPINFADTCYWTFKTRVQAPVYYYKSAANNGLIIIDSTTIANWKQYVDEDGFIYFRANPTRVGDLIFMSDKPEEVDPEPEEPETDASIVVSCVADGVKIDVKEEQTVMLYQGDNLLETLQMTPGQPVVRPLQAGAKYKLVGKDTIHVML